jgi:phosphotransferase system enzyme I (PtsP)
MSEHFQNQLRFFGMAPRFRYSPELGADPYHAFLGVPLIHFRRVLGVLVTRLRIRRLFNSDEVAFLVTIGAQLAGAINHATAGDAISRLLSEQPQPLALVQGIAATPGVGIGTIVLCSPLSNLVSVPDREPQDIDAEEAAFRAALVAVRKELRAGGERLAAALPTEARAVLDAYMTLLDGDHLITDTIKRVRAGNWAPGALRDTIAEYAQVFDQMEDSYLRARAEDIRGIGRRVLIRLQSYVSNPTRYPQSCILVGEEISIARIAEVPVGQLSGIVCTRGSVFSHAAILARALGIPAVMGIGDLPLGRLEGVNIVVDGYQGRIFINPSAAVLDEFQRLVREEEELSAELEALRDLPAETTDCARVLLYSNVALLSDITPSLNNAADRIYLYDAGSFSKRGRAVSGLSKGIGVLRSKAGYHSYPRRGRRQEPTLLPHRRAQFVSWLAWDSHKS